MTEILLLNVDTQFDVVPVDSDPCPSNVGGSGFVNLALGW